LKEVSTAFEMAHRRCRLYGHIRSPYKVRCLKHSYTRHIISDKKKKEIHIHTTYGTRTIMSILSINSA